MDNVFAEVYVKLQTSVLYNELDVLYKHKYEIYNRECIELIEYILEERLMQQANKRRRVG